MESMIIANAPIPITKYLVLELFGHVFRMQLKPIPATFAAQIISTENELLSSSPNKKELWMKTK